MMCSCDDGRDDEEEQLADEDVEEQAGGQRQRPRELFDHVDREKPRERLNQMRGVRAWEADEPGGEATP